MQKWVKVLSVLLAVYAGIFYAMTAHTDNAAKKAEDAAKGKDFTEEVAVKMLSDRTIGIDTAPVRMLYISALSCSHCSELHEKVLPVLEEKYVKTGKVKIQFVDLPSDASAFAASTLAHCVPEENYFPLVDMLYKKQADWALGKSSLEEKLVQYGTLFGLAPAKAKQCLHSKALYEQMMKKRKFILETYKVRGTPMLILIKGEDSVRVDGIVPTLPMIEQKLEPLLELK